MRPACIAIAVTGLLASGCQTKSGPSSCSQVYRETLTDLSASSDLDDAMREECKAIVAEQKIRTELLDRSAIEADVHHMEGWEHRILSGSLGELSALASCYRSLNLFEASGGIHITVYMRADRKVVLVTSSAVFF